MSPPSFTYGDVPISASRKEIRLIRSLASKNDYSPRCSMKVVSLLQKHDYETISYCWHDSSQRESILVNDKSLNVPASAAAVLKRVSLMLDNSSVGIALGLLSRWIWIDAICIDQHNRRERSQQVQLMALIYERSRRTIIELGGVRYSQRKMMSSESRLQISRVMRLVQRQIKKLPRGATDGVSCGEPELSAIVDASPYLNDLYTQKWFSRLWVMQEAIACPRTVCMYGDLKMSFLQLVTLAQIITAHDIEIQGALPWLEGIKVCGFIADFIYPTRCIHREGADVLTTLAFTRHLHTSEPRDHVFGVLGLMSCARPPRRIPRELAPDYTKSLQEVYRDATRFALQEQAHSAGAEPLDKVFREVIAYESLDPDDEDWPTWVPRLNNPDPDPWIAEPTPAACEVSWTLIQAAGTYALIEDPNILTVSGMIVGKPLEISSLFDAFPEADGAFRTMEWLSEVQSLPRLDQKSSTAALLNVLTSANASTSYSKLVDADDMTAGYHHFINLLRELAAEERDTEQPSDKAFDPRTLWHRMLAATCHDRRYLVMPDGQTGLGPGLMQSGDLVVVIYGVRYPLVLRPFGEYFKLVGLCTLPAIMDGEAVKQHRLSGKADEVFQIC